MQNQGIILSFMLFLMEGEGGWGGGGGGLEWLFDNFICNCTSVNPLNNNTFLSGSFLSEMFG